MKSLSSRRKDLIFKFSRRSAGHHKFSAWFEQTKGDTQQDEQNHYIKRSKQEQLDMIVHPYQQYQKWYLGICQWPTFHQMFINNNDNEAECYAFRVFEYCFLYIYVIKFLYP